MWLRRRGRLLVRASLCDGCFGLASFRLWTGLLTSELTHLTECRSRVKALKDVFRQFANNIVTARGTFSENLSDIARGAIGAQR